MFTSLFLHVMDSLPTRIIFIPPFAYPPDYYPSFPITLTTHILYTMSIFTLVLCFIPASSIIVILYNSHFGVVFPDSTSCTFPSSPSDQLPARISRKLNACSRNVKLSISQFIKSEKANGVLIRLLYYLPERDFFHLLAIC